MNTKVQLADTCCIMQAAACTRAVYDCMRALQICPACCLLQVRAAFAAANATASFLPAAPALGALAVDYNLAVWEGNTTAYLTCNLDIRGPEYLGTCVDMPVTCAANTAASDARPYNCTRLSDGGVVAGNISDASYRCVLRPRQGQTTAPFGLGATRVGVCSSGVGPFQPGARIIWHQRL